MRFISILLFLTLILIASCARDAARSLMDQATELEAQGNYAEALVVLERIVKEHPDSPHAPAALFRCAWLYNNEQEDALKAATTYELVNDRYPDSEYGHKGLFAAGFTYANELENVERAKAAYDKYLSMYADSSMAETVRFELEHLGSSPDIVLQMLQEQNPEPLAPTPPDYE